VKLLALFAAVLLLPQEKKEAEALFKKAEEKLAKAKSVHVKSSGSSAMGAGEMTLTVEALWEGENRVRVESEMKVPGMDGQKSVFVSDGKSARSSDGEKTLAGAAREKLTGDLAKAWLRGGGMFTAMWIEVATFKDKDHPKREKLPVCSKFKLGPKEKIDGRDVHRIEYSGEFESGEVPCVVWIDAETLLPLKREMRGFHGQEKLTFVETFTGFKLDEKIESSKFEIPKESK